MHSARSIHADHPVRIRAITVDHPLRWLSAGWQDMRTAPGASFFFGAAFAAIGFILMYGLDRLGAGSLILPLALGFALVGPAVAVGLYETSRRLDAGRAPDPSDAFLRNPVQITLVGAFLMFVFYLWVRLALFECQLLLGAEPASLYGLLRAVLASPQGWAFLAAGAATGGVLAGIVFAVTVVAVPMLIDRPECDAMTAMTTSVAAVRRNWLPMAVWAALIAFFTLFGLVMFFVGLIFTVPLIGHASWHAYRDLVH